MATGEAVKQDFKKISNNPARKAALPTNLLPATSVDDCCFEIPVLAVAGGTNDQNDQSSVLWFYDDAFVSAVMNLQKSTGGVFSTVAALVDNTFGTYNGFGFEINQLDENLMGYLFDWEKVLSIHGEGTYRVQTVETTVFGAPALNQESVEFCLSTYTDYRANITTRFSWFNNGVIGDEEDDERVRDFGDLNWFNQIRVPESTFGEDKNDIERESVRYQNGREVWLQDNNTEVYTFKSGRYPDYVHRILKYDMLQADQISVTNYDADAPNAHVDKKVVPRSSYEPNYIRRSKLSSVELTFEQEFRNHRHKRC